MEHTTPQDQIVQLLDGISIFTTSKDETYLGTLDKSFICFCRDINDQTSFNRVYIHCSKALQQWQGRTETLKNILTKFSLCSETVTNEDANHFLQEINPNFKLISSTKDGQTIRFLLFHGEILYRFEELWVGYPSSSDEIIQKVSLKMKIAEEKAKKVVKNVTFTIPKTD